MKDPYWVNGLINPDNENEYSVQPYLLTAVHSQLPNLEVIKILVERFGANVNIQPPIRTYGSGGGYEYPPGATALHIVACRINWWQAEVVKYLLSKGANTELRNEKGQTALHVVLSNNRSYRRDQQRITTKILLEHGADPNTQDKNGLTCLNKATYDAELVRMLIKHGADITLGSKPALFSAIIGEDLPTIKILLGAGADCNAREKKSDRPGHLVVDWIEDHEYYPLHYAASAIADNLQKRDTAISIINTLLEHGADPYIQFREDACVLHHILGHGGILQPFLDLPDLDLERRDPKGRTLLLAACSSSRDTHFPTNLYTALCEPTRLERKNTATKDNETAALTLFEMGADLVAVDHDGNNALHLLILATPHNDDECKKTITALIEKAPSLVLQKNSQGYTPYHYAVQKCWIWTARELIKAGANPVEQDPEGNTALHYLASIMYEGGSGWASTFKEFLDLGVSVNTKNYRGETPLFRYFTIECPRANISQARKHFSPFTEAGADVLVVNSEGEGLLHVVAKRERAEDVVDAFKFLMEMGLDPQMEDRRQRSALVSTCFLLFFLD